MLRYNQGMFIVGLLSWWYGAGWARCVRKAQSNLMSIYDYFSIDLLAKTLFAPFRQISAGKVRGPIGVQMRALLDNLISRVVGGVVRTIVLIIGIVTLAISGVIGGLAIVLWPLVPALPFIGLVVALTGWVPWKI